MSLALVNNLQIFRHFVLATAAVTLMSCKTCEQAWKDYRKTIHKKAEFGACTVNFDCVRVKEIPHLVYSKLTISLPDQQKIEERRGRARQICLDQSQNKARRHGKNVKISPLLPRYADKIVDEEPCCVKGQCILTKPGSCAFKKPPK